MGDTVFLNHSEINPSAVLPQLNKISMVINDPILKSRLEMCLKRLFPRVKFQTPEYLIDCEARLLITDLDPSLNEVQRLCGKNILILVVTEQSLWGLDIPGVRYLLSPFNMLELKSRICEVFNT
ncbi:MAG: hypothetical protein ACWA5R_09360 [bacterium]